MPVYIVHDSRKRGKANPKTGSAWKNTVAAKPAMHAMHVRDSNLNVHVPCTKAAQIYSVYMYMYRQFCIIMSKFASFLSQILLLCSSCDSSSCPFPPARRPVSETGGERGWAEGGGGGGCLCHPGRHKVWSQITETGLIVYIYVIMTTVLE